MLPQIPPLNTSTLMVTRILLALVVITESYPKQRAEKVTAYLLQKGIPPEKIVSRYHGERYPVAANNRTNDGRERNRRVTIRLERANNANHYLNRVNKRYLYSNYPFYFP